MPNEHASMVSIIIYFTLGMVIHNTLSGGVVLVGTMVFMDFGPIFLFLFGGGGE